MSGPSWRERAPRWSVSSRLFIHLQRAQFGRRSERLDGDQLAARSRRPRCRHCPGAGAVGLLAVDDASPEPAATTSADCRIHLAREDMTATSPAQACPCCGGALHPIGESVSEMLDFVPARLRCCASAGRSTAAALAGRSIRHQHRSADRQGLASPCPARPCAGQQILRSHSRSTDSPRSSPGTVSSLTVDPANWVGGACWWLEPLQARLPPTSSRSHKLVRRRHADPGARSRPRPHQDRPAVGLHAR